MNADELWRRLSRTDVLPSEAIGEALEHWDEVSDRFLAKLRAKAAGAKLSETDLDALFVVVHLFAEKRDTRAYAPLCAELGRDLDETGWLGDAMSEHLPSLLINLYDGDPAPLHGLAESINADAIARGAALEALGYLTRAEQAIPDEAMHAYLLEFGRNLDDAEDPILGWSWAVTIAALGYDDLGPEVARAISRGAIDVEMYTIKDFHADLAEARSADDGLALFAREGIGPFGSTVEALSEWNWGENPEEEFPGEAFEPQAAPTVNPFRDVGRNDPCPCGSGKKYKKCCLAA